MNPPSLLTGLGAGIGADPGGPGTSGRAATPGASDLFLSLVAGLLQGDQGGSPTTGTTTPAPADPSVAPEPALAVPQPGTDDEQAEPATGDPAASVVPPTLTAIIAQAMTAASTPAVAPLANQAGTGSANGSAEAQEPTVDGVEATTTGPAAAVATAVDQTRTVGVPTTDGATSVATPAASSTQTAPDEVTAEAPADPATPLTAHQGARADSRADAAPVPTAPASLTAVAATAAPVAVSGATAPPTEVQRITGQVFPEVVRVAAAPGGTQRVTVRLNPEALGEVRVILTHHKGELEVSLAGGEAARRALTEGAPELRRLLESVGRPDSRIVIRDLPGTSPTPVPAVVQDGSALRTDVSTDLGGNAWSGAGRPGGESAADQETARYRIPGSTNATDGTRDSTIPSRPSTTDASGRLGGLDVSI